MSKKTAKNEKIAKVPATKISDYINWLTKDKKPWNQLSLEEQKGFQVFIINRFLSMDYYFCEAVNTFQKLTCSMEKEMVWKFYLEILPKENFYVKYIKPEEKEVTNKEILSFVKHFSCTEEIAMEYVMLLKRKDLQDEIKKIVELYGKNL